MAFSSDSIFYGADGYGAASNTQAAIYWDGSNWVVQGGSGLFVSCAFRSYGTLAATATNVNPFDNSNNGYLVMPFSGSLVALEVHCTAGTRTAGTATIGAVIGSTQVASVTLDATNTVAARATYAPGTYTFTAGQNLFARATTSAFATSGANVVAVSLWVAL